MDTPLYQPGSPVVRLRDVQFTQGAQGKRNIAKATFTSSDGVPYTVTVKYGRDVTCTEDDIRRFIGTAFDNMAKSKMDALVDSKLKGQLSTPVPAQAAGATQSPPSVQIFEKTKRKRDEQTPGERYAKGFNQLVYEWYTDPSSSTGASSSNAAAERRARLVEQEARDAQQKIQWFFNSMYGMGQRAEGATSAPAAAATTTASAAPSSALSSQPAPQRTTSSTDSGALDAQSSTTQDLAAIPAPTVTTAASNPPPANIFQEELSSTRAATVATTATTTTTSPAFVAAAVPTPSSPAAAAALTALSQLSGAASPNVASHDNVTISVASGNPTTTTGTTATVLTPASAPKQGVLERVKGAITGLFSSSKSTVAPAPPSPSPFDSITFTVDRGTSTNPPSQSDPNDSSRP